MSGSHAAASFSSRRVGDREWCVVRGRAAAPDPELAPNPPPPGDLPGDGVPRDVAGRRNMLDAGAMGTAAFSGDVYGSNGGSWDDTPG